MFINVEDLKDPHDLQGRTYRQVNAEKQHAIPLGALVELETGERLRVMMHTRDCDQTPLYSLGLTGDDEDVILDIDVDSGQITNWKKPSAEQMQEFINGNGDD